MGCWDIFCFICGNTCHGDLKTDDLEYNVSNQFSKKLQWLNKCTFLTANNEIIHNCKEISCNIDFKDNKGNIYEHVFKYNTKYYNDYDYYYGVNKNIGIFLHTDCWKFIKNTYKLELKYLHLPIIYKNITENKIFNIDYDKIEKYWSQDFNFKQVLDDKNEYLCESPLKNEKSAKRIKHIFCKLKIKNDENRKSPLTSATFYDENSIKIGNDNNFWIKNGGKWIKMDGKIKTIKFKLTDKIKIKKLKSIPQNGYFNNVPIFISSLEITKNKNLEIKIIYLTQNDNHNLII
jgi:hypothetical protein